MTPTMLASTVLRKSREENNTRNGEVAGKPFVKSFASTCNGDSAGVRIRARM